MGRRWTLTSCRSSASACRWGKRRVSHIIRVVPENDQQDEQDETITFSSDHPLVVTSATLTLMDDDAAPSGLSIGLDPTAVAEDAGPTEVTVTLAVEGATRYATRQALTVDAVGSGVAGVVGFTPLPPLEVVIEAGADVGSATFVIVPEDDVIDEADESVTLTARNDALEVSVVLALIDDDMPPTGVTLVLEPGLVSEDAGPTPVHVTATVGGGTLYAAAQSLAVSIAEPMAGAVGYEVVPDFTMEIPAGTKTVGRTFTLTPIDNRVRDRDATVTVAARHAGTMITADLLIVDNDEVTARATEVNRVVLPEITRAIVASTVDAVSERIRAFRGGGAVPQGGITRAVAGLARGLQHDVRMANPQGRALRTWGERLGGTTVASGMGGRFTVWGHADYRSLSGHGTAHPVDFKGNVTGLHAGVDMVLGKAMLVGLSASSVSGGLDYSYLGGANQRTPGATLKGAYESGTGSISPYLSWSWSKDSGVWMLASIGGGDVSLADPELSEETGDTQLRSGALGVTIRLLDSRSGLSVDLKGAAFSAGMGLDENNAQLAALDVHVSRLQVSFEGGYSMLVGEGDCNVFEPFIEAGVRSDIGDGQTGRGIQVGGGARYTQPAMGLRFSADGHMLLHHQGTMEEWGFGGMFNYTPGGDRGLAVQLGSTSGAASAGVQRIWTDQAWAARGGRMSAKPRMHSHVGYGFGVGAGTITPFSGVEMGNGLNTSVGAEYRIGSGFRFRMEAAHLLPSGPHRQDPVIRGAIQLVPQSASDKL